MVVIKPLRIIKFLLITSATGAKQFVVQDAAEIILSFFVDLLMIYAKNYSFVCHFTWGNINNFLPHFLYVVVIDLLELNLPVHSKT